MRWSELKAVGRSGRCALSTDLRMLRSSPSLEGSLARSVPIAAPTSWSATSLYEVVPNAWTAWQTLREKPRSVASAALAMAAGSRTRFFDLAFAPATSMVCGVVNNEVGPATSALGSGSDMMQGSAMAAARVHGVRQNARAGAR